MLGKQLITTVIIYRPGMSRPDTHPQTMQPIQITTFQALRRSLGLIIKAAPIELRNLILLNIIRGAAPSGVLFLDKLIIDEVSRLLSRVQTAQPLALMLSHPILLWSIAGVLSLKLIGDSLETMSSFAATSLRDRVQGFVEGKVLEKVANFDDIALFENPELLNIVELAKTGVSKIQQLAFTVSMTITGIFIFIPSVSLAAAIAWWVPLLMLISSSPSIYIERKYSRIIWRIQKKQAKILKTICLLIFDFLGYFFRSGNNISKVIPAIYPTTLGSPLKPVNLGESSGLKPGIIYILIIP